MNKKNYIKAASLMETVMAISMITLCSLVGTLIYGSVIKVTPPIVRYSYEAALEASLEEIITGNPTGFKKEKTKTFKLEQRNLNKNVFNDVLEVEIIVRTPYDTLVSPRYNYKKSL